jgi:hypothetical protein
MEYCSRCLLELYGEEKNFLPLPGIEPWPSSPLPYRLSCPYSCRYRGSHFNLPHDGFLSRFSTLNRHPTTRVVETQSEKRHSFTKPRHDNTKLPATVNETVICIVSQKPRVKETAILMRRYQIQHSRCCYRLEATKYLAVYSHICIDAERV